ncbi:MAG TPA: DUF5684 domain-containing protein [Chitinophagales bacterium]|nr:DUF5684 domain-containing protein [Chitinophagales bacterium]
MVAIVVIYIAVIVMMFAALWRIFEKAGQPGWAAIVPIYNLLIELRIIHKPWWWILMFLIPLVNIIFAIWMVNLISKSFGKDEGFTIGLLLLPFVFYPILAWGKATYQGGIVRESDPTVIDSGAMS